MRKGILCVATVLLLMMAGVAHAITYNVNRTIGAGTVTGFVETDGTIGILSSGNITNWNLTLAAPNLLGGSPHSLTQYITYLTGSGTVATATQILFDFNTVNSIFLLQSDLPNQNYWCLETAGCAGAGLGESIGFSDTGSGVAQFESRSGQIVIASVSVIPLPAALWGFGAGLIGLLGIRKYLTIRG